VIPLQDIVPTRQFPIATLALIGATALYGLAVGIDMPGSRIGAPFTHTSVATFVAGLWLLWLFGDNVEMRLGRVMLGVIYLAGGLVPGLGASGAVTAVMGSYFVLLPQSRVLTLIPAPSILVEVPAPFFLGVWVVLHLWRLVANPQAVWMFGLTFLFGAALARLTRRPITWT
jgi:membrane associated rhomboid family serine protease